MLLPVFTNSFTTVPPVKPVPVSVALAPTVITPPATGSSVGAPGGAGSSLVIVPSPWLSAIVTKVAEERFTKYVSSPSNRLSPSTTTVTVCVVEPGGKVSVPETDP